MPFPQTFSALMQAGYRFSNHAKCRGCHADIEWWTTPNDRKMPFDPMDETNEAAPAVSHHATCPNAEDFRGGAR